MKQVSFRGLTRLGRAIALGATTLLLTLTAHTAAGAALPATLEISLLLPLALALGYAASDRRRSLTWLAIYVLAVQVLFHVLLIATGSHLAHQSWLPSPNMLISHGLAAVALAWVLAQGESTLSNWSRYLAQAIGMSPVPMRTSYKHSCAPANHTPAHTEHGAIRAISRRGPPTLCNN